MYLAPLARSQSASVNQIISQSLKHICQENYLSCIAFTRNISLDFISRYTYSLLIFFSSSLYSGKLSEIRTEKEERSSGEEEVG